MYDRQNVVVNFQYLELISLYCQSTLTLYYLHYSVIYHTKNISRRWRNSVLSIFRHCCELKLPQKLPDTPYVPRLETVTLQLTTTGTFFTSVSSNNARASTSTLDVCSDIIKLWKNCKCSNNYQSTISFKIRMPFIVYAFVFFV